MQLSAAIWILEMKPRFSARAASVLKLLSDLSRLGLKVLMAQYMQRVFASAIFQ